MAGRPCSREALFDWLLEGDPAIRWQALAHLGAAPSEIEQARHEVATCGWGAELLSRQDSDGRWAGAIYSPKWTSTTYTLLLLRRLGLPAGHDGALAGCRVLWDAARFFDGGGLNLAKTVRAPETCITAMVVLLTDTFGYADPRAQAAVDWLVGEQLPDGGWNCETVRGARHGSFHTTISVLECLQEQHRSPDDAEVAAALAAGREFLLRHRMFRSHRTGEVVDQAYLRFPFPPQWHYDVLRGLEHLADAQVAPDERAAEAVEAVRAARRTDGAWPRHRPWPGRQWLSLEGPGPSRWTTLRALRVLDWWGEG
ncbi:hypothetical protein [Nocardioides ferulae]|uniref:hypothetical protein n=1 Tax=Nocardioides ferulae TaxID=2340821 RepID=UPI00197ECEDE|nr:hypothetical protein [Nocardioides ferulae]